MIPMSELSKYQQQKKMEHLGNFIERKAGDPTLGFIVIAVDETGEIHCITKLNDESTHHVLSKLIGRLDKQLAYKNN